MISKEELEKWLQTLPEDDGISIAEDGLCLVSCDSDGAYLEVGGETLHDDLEADNAAKPKFKTLMVGLSESHPVPSSYGGIGRNAGVWNLTYTRDQSGAAFAIVKSEWNWDETVLMVTPPSTMQETDEGYNLAKAVWQVYDADARSTKKQRIAEAMIWQHVAQRVSMEVFADLLAHLGEHHAVKGAERKAEQINDLLRAQAEARARIGLYDA